MHILLATWQVHGKAHRRGVVRVAQRGFASSASGYPRHALAGQPGANRICGATASMRFLEIGTHGGVIGERWLAHLRVAQLRVWAPRSWQRQALLEDAAFRIELGPQFDARQKVSLPSWGPSES